ncbi:hypothetical protein [Massilia niabensis]|uniref:Uncharacterized protein n=1 Tax=Massilia niabensis TaxID=544910 RepID=A0ABW0L9P2_9BURK
MIRILTVYLGLSILLGLVFVVFSWPDLPSTPAQWMAVFLLALPVQLAGELVGNCLWNNRLARSVDQATAHQSLSLLRIGYGVFAILSCIGLAFTAIYGWRLLQPLLAG